MYCDLHLPYASPDPGVRAGGGCDGRQHAEGSQRERCRQCQGERRV